MTYPDAEVGKLLDERFIAVQVNTREPHPELRDLFRSAKPIWAPMFVAYAGRGSELARWTGFLPPDEFRARLHIALALERLIAREPQSAGLELDRASRLTAIDDVKAEVSYWQGAAAYKSGGLEALERVWGELRNRHPESRWAMSADVLEMKDAADRTES